MANNVQAAIVNGQLVLTVALDKVAHRTSKDTGDVLADVQFEKLSAICPQVQGALGEVKVSLGVYFMDKARQAATTQAPAKPASKRVEDMSKDELLALLASKQAVAPVQTPAPVKPAKPASPAQIAARIRFAEAAKAGTLKKATPEK